MPTQTTPPKSRVDMLERLYVLWLMSTLLLVLLVGGLTLFGAGLLRRQGDAVRELTARVEALESATHVPTPQAAPTSPPAAKSPQPAPTTQPAPRRRPATQSSTQPRSQSAPASVTEESDIESQLDLALGRGAMIRYPLRDEQAGVAVLRQALTHSDSADWSGRIWLRLAVVARLLNREQSAELFAGKANSAGERLGPYYLAAGRMTLASGKSAEAITYADRALQLDPQDSDARLLLAEAYASRGSFGQADAVMAELAEPQTLQPAERLRLGRLLLKLESWNALDRVLQTLTRVSAEFQPDRDFLRATLLIQDQEYVKALAILDFLLEQRPADYDLNTWRGVALLEAGQYQAAREALAVAQQQPNRPEAWHWQGVLEQRLGQTEAAISALQKALAAAPNFGASWEALGSLALNAGDAETALTNFANATQANPRRASAHFLTALAYAKIARRDEAEAALERAIRIDPMWRDVAARTPALNRVLNLSAEAGPSEPASEEPAPASQTQPAPPDSPSSP